jgi:hypothetical protein
MKLKVIGCLVVTVLIVGMYVIMAYGDDLGIVHPINRSNTFNDFVDRNAVAPLPFDNNSIIELEDHNEAYYINWSD